MEKPARKILLVEDDKNLGFIVKDFLELSGFRIDLKENGVEGLKAFNSGLYDLCLLDIMLPLKDGFTLAAEIREKDPHIPIIFFTSKNLTQDKIKGFRIGGDDYITKPFSIEELLARIEAVLRRVQIQPTAEGGSKKHQLGRFVFDHDNSTICFNGEVTRLSAKENDLLKLLWDNKNRVVKREYALTNVWGENNYFLGRSMDVYIAKLRKHLQADQSIAITNLHGVGFSLQTKHGHEKV